MLPEQSMSSSYNIHARLRGVARARAAPVHVRGAGEHRAGTAQRVPTDRRRAADTRPHRLFTTQRQSNPYISSLLHHLCVLLR